VCQTFIVLEWQQMTQINKLLCIARLLLVAVTKESAELSARAEILAW
jgi:hypothetical protein